jgi:hypothetical protein
MTHSNAPHASPPPNTKFLHNRSLSSKGGMHAVWTDVLGWLDREVVIEDGCGNFVCPGTKDAETGFGSLTQMSMYEGIKAPPKVFGTNTCAL